MGSKDRRRSRSSSSSDSSAERHKKEKKSKHKHKHKHKHKKHKKHESEVDEEKLRAAKALLEQHLKHTAGAGDAIAAAAGSGSSGKDRSKQKAEKPAGLLPPGMPTLSADDYFERSGEFTAWLQEVKHQYFNELTTEQSHSMFSDFVDAWNSGQLPLRFYQGLAAAPLKRTSYSWNLKSKPGSAAAEATRLGMTAFLQDQQQQHGEQRATARAGEVQERKAWRHQQKDLLDELLPKATGGTREARVEARMARREEARAREESPDTVPVAGSIMGGDDSFAAAKAREAKRQEWRQKQQAAKKEELAVKLSAAAQAEADKIAQFRALVTAQGGKIQIPKRQ